MIFFYNILSENYSRKIVSLQTKSGLKSFKPSLIIPRIPKNMDVKKWGDFVYNAKEKIYNITIKDSMFIAKVIRQYKQNVVYILVQKIGGLYEVLKFRDEILEDSRDLYTFKRVYKNTTIYFKKGIKVLILEMIKCTFITKLKEQKEPKFKIITMDLETREVIKDDKTKRMEPVCISIYIGGESNHQIISFKI
jgi:hypothetical protein